ncbi:MAG: hypothetical protein IKJ17_03875 [Clostridia bacterium]|nr:hypothetical protein [Clostridia bacterium]
MTEVKSGCKGCFYWRELYDDLFACHYMLHTGKRRPCEAGKKCKVMMKRGVSSSMNCLTA